MTYFQRVFDSKFYQEGNEESKQKIRHLRQNLNRAACRPSPRKISVTLDEAFKVGEKQGWKDPYSGDPLEFVRGGDYGMTSNTGKSACNPFSCSIDRIDPKKDYVKGNIELVTTVTNMSKGNLSRKEYVEQCKKVVQNCQ
jgi:hypothetical protein